MLFSSRKVFCYSLLLSLFVCSASFGGHFKGRVLDARSAEPLPGVRIIINETGAGAVSGLDGTFKIKKISAGTYTFRIKYTGYKLYSDTIIIGSEEDDKDDVKKQILLTPLSGTGSEVLVTSALDHGSDATAIKTVQQANNVVNEVSARAIEVSPDISVANVSQRVSGVSIERNSNGDGQYAIIRGMDKRYNYTLVNGIKIPSPDNKNRYVPLDIFPAELLDRLEVTKSLLPSIEGDAIGGSMNLVMKDAPNAFLLQASAGSGYGQLFFDRKFNSFDASVINAKSPRERGVAASITDFPTANANFTLKSAPINSFFSATIGDRFLEDNALGVILSGSYQNTTRGANTIFFETETDRTTNAPSLQGIEERRYSVEQTRAGIHTKVDYRLDAGNALNLYGAFVSLAKDESRDASDTNLVLGRKGPGTGRVGYTRRATEEIQTIGNVTVSGDHSIFGEALRLNWSGVYSSALFSQPDRVSIELTTGVDKDANGNFIQNPVFLDQGSSRRWEHNTDDDKTIYLNLLSTDEVFETDVEFSAGGLYRLKDRSSFFDEYNLRPDPSPQVYDGDITHNTFSVFNPLGTSTSALNYDSHENILAYYGQLKFQIGNLLTIAGVRIENTDFGWVTAAPETVEGQTGGITYTDVLPMVNFKFMPTPTQNWRLSYYASISRPGFFEVIPFNIHGEDYSELGNPYLKRVQADNIDLRYEYFPQALDQILAGVFYKHLVNPIEYALEEKGVNLFYVPDNFGTATNYGLEVDFTKYIEKFGVKLNYTFTKSGITTDKIVRFRNDQGQLSQRTEPQSRPLQGQSEHIGNFSLLYKDFDIDFNAQLGLVYTGERIVTVSPYKDNDYWQRPTFQLDFSAEKGIFGSLTLYLKITNILDSPFEVEIKHINGEEAAGIAYQEIGKNVLVRRDTYDRTFQLGVRFRP